MRPLTLRAARLQLVYAVLGGYAVLVTVFQIRGGFKKSAAIAAQPAPETPDYHTRESAAGPCGVGENAHRVGDCD